MKKNDTVFDVAIIGGGPAGATFARELATKCPELKIAIIDKKNNSDIKVCGGLLSPDAQKILARLDMTLPKRILSDPQIFTVETIDLCSKQRRYYQRHYLNMNRSDFGSIKKYI
jgi:flavin-dependent dehydrogenase